MLIPHGRFNSDCFGTCIFVYIYNIHIYCIGLQPEIMYEATFLDIYNNFWQFLMASLDVESVDSVDTAS